MIELAFGILGGLGLFLFGMQYMAEGLQKIAGERMRRILQVLTGTPLIGILVGALVTAVIQSSSATTVMVVGFVNAGLMTIKQAVGIIMGANIGTTVTAQLVAFNFEIISLPAIGIGCGLILFSRRRTHRYIGQIVLGFGLLFLGMRTMKLALSPLSQEAIFVSWMSKFSHSPLLGVLVGLIVTSIIQSSSASTAIILALASQGILSFEGAIPIIFGCNIGTTVTALLASIGTITTARRTAMVHALFNVFGAIIALILLKPFIQLVLLLSPTNDIPRQIANAHTIFNITNTLVWLPFTGVLASLATKLVRGSDADMHRGAKYLEHHALRTPSVALELAEKEIAHMAEIARNMLDDAYTAFMDKNLDILDRIQKNEELVDELEPLIVEYLATLLSQSTLTDKQSKRLTGLMHTATDIERVADHAMNIGEAAEAIVEQKLPFSDLAVEEISSMFKRVVEMFDTALAALYKNDKKKTDNVVKIEEEIDKTKAQLRQNHIERINEGKCFPGSGIVYIELLSDLERIADHSTNIAETAVTSPSILHETGNNNKKPQGPSADD